MKYSILSIFCGLLLCCTSPTFAQCSGNIMLTNQAEVDAFPTNYGCTEIEGDLFIGSWKPGVDIVSLDVLESITSIEGDLNISFNEGLNSLHGLHNLEFIGGDLRIANNYGLENLQELSNLTDFGGSIDIESNNELASLNGLENITDINDLDIWNNSSLINLEGLHNLNSIEGYLDIEDHSILNSLSALQNINSIGGYVKIWDNDDLTSLNGLHNITDIGGNLAITTCDALSNVDALQNLTNVGGYLNIQSNNTLSNLDGLSNLTHIGNYVWIWGNNVLTNLTPLQNLNTISGSLHITSNNSLNNLNDLLNITNVNGKIWIRNNNNLSNLDGLENLTHIDGNLWIRDNDDLENLDGISNLTFVGGDLTIDDNPMLDICCPVLNFIDDVQGAVTIEDNLPNCNSVTAITDFCPDVVEVGFEVGLKIFLEGLYVENGLMSNLLQDLIPLQQPYDNSPWNYGGEESITQPLSNMVDWVLVEARTGTPNDTSQATTVVETKASILLANGDIVGTDGDLLRFTNLEGGQSYHFSIRHRNHLDILSASSLTANGEMQYDFSTNPNNAFGSQQQKVSEDGISLMISGDANGDGVILNTDYDLWFINNAVLNTYSPTDWNLDGTIQVTDYDLWFDNKAKIGVVELQYF